MYTLRPFHKRRVFVLISVSWTSRHCGRSATQVSLQARPRRQPGTSSELHAAVASEFCL